MKKSTNAVQIICTLCSILWLQGCGSSEQSNESSNIVPEETNPLTVAAAESPVQKPDVASLNKELVREVQLGNLDEVKSLLDQGATIAAADRYGLPVLFMASKSGHIEMARSFLTAGADVNGIVGTSFNEDGVGYAGTVSGTPLTYAASAGQVEMMKFLAQSGALINGQGPEGTTALMRAAQHGHLQAVKWLLANGASPHLTNNQGGNALSYSTMMINPNEDMKAIIKLLGGK